MGGPVVHDPEHPVRAGTWLGGHHLPGQPGEGRDPGRAPAPAGHLPAADVPGGQVGQGAAAFVVVLDTHRAERYRWQPVKRVYIPKKSGKRRPMGLPTWSDELSPKLCDCCWRRTTSPGSPAAPTVSAPAMAATPRSARSWRHGVVATWKGTHWFIEGDISDCLRLRS